MYVTSEMLKQEASEGIPGVCIVWKHETDLE